MKQEHLYYGELISDDGLAPVARALAGCSWPIELRRSGFDGTFYLRTTTAQDEVDLEMDSGQSGRYLFSGDIGGTTECALSLIGEFSRCLTAGGFTHRVEVYNEAQELVGYLHHGWPQGKDEPAGQ